MPNAGIMASSVVPAAGTDVLFEPFNNLTAWTTIAGAPTIVAARTGNGVQVKSGDQIRYTIPAPSESATLTVGVAMRIATALNASGASMVWFRSDANTADHVAVRVESTGGMSFRIGGLAVGGTAPAGTIALNTWYYIEVQAYLHDTAGFVTVRVGGTVVINSTGIDTKAAGTKTTFDTVRLNGNSSGNNTLYDDLYITTGAGAPFKGDITIP